MITQVLEPALLSHLYHSCALKSVEKSFFDCLSVWLTKRRQRSCNKVRLGMEDPIVLPLKATALPPTSVEVRLFLKTVGKVFSRRNSNSASQQSSLQEQEPQPYPFPHGEEQFLCICHYTAHVKDYWKTSGSVFFKHLPSGLQTQPPLLLRAFQKQHPINAILSEYDVCMIYVIYYRIFTTSERQHSRKWLADGETEVQRRANYTPFLMTYKPRDFSEAVCNICSQAKELRAHKCKEK